MSIFVQLKNFIAIVESKSFTKASEVLHQSIPSTSRQLNELEQKLGQVLILRTSKSLSLTEFGQMYYEEAKELMYQYQHMESMTNLYDKLPSGILKIASPSCVIRKNILPHLKEFSLLYPQIIPDIEITDGTIEIHKGNIDVAIMMDFLIERLESNQRDIIKRHLYDTKTILCCSKEYLANNKITLPEDLQKHKYITNSKRFQPKQIKLKNYM
jgi:DNA-binding transcriptional LysR family regulator